LRFFCCEILNVSLWTGGQQNNAAANALQKQFGLSDTQMGMVLQWLNASFLPSRLTG
jgi:hypothetical protein